MILLLLLKCLAIPLLEVWSDYLWERGRDEKLIRLLSESMGQGYAAGRVLPAPEEWQRGAKRVGIRRDFVLTLHRCQQTSPH